ncbi:PREDICTED: lipid phosphate phosphatase-related protein type 3 isoform X5 [Calidris pugnax]|uniref:lipid phosphate phosphatase-related protein type 3 isoform X4 n=1 Tax=Calidris pugnax TaxID=198806 RepID=UPI00071D227E|nr:PREDICTED: lipid phosphate phosphatase-related protein type 3 isoform X4 [Calidris pugnax]XP_014814071.1 PREDICTED: lipid phosphate phosphatase-related protein type 3 isoform X5 [Calidris pugnax]
MIPPKEKARAPKDSMTLLPCFYFVELPIVASSIVTLYFLELTDLFKPAKVGFQCYDRALSMPYVETNEELIPLLMLLSLAFAAPAASIMVGEGIVYCLQSRLKGRAGAEGSINAGGCNFNSFLRRTVRRPRVRALCHGPGDRRYPTGHGLPRALLPDRLQAQLHAAGHPLRRQPLHHPGHLLGHGQARHPLRQEDVPVPARHALRFRCRLRVDVFQLHHLGQHQAPQAHPGLRLRHRRRHLRPDPDHPVPQPPRRRLRGLPHRLRHRCLPGLPRCWQLPSPNGEGPGAGASQGRAAGTDAAGPRLCLPPEQVGEHRRAEPPDAAGGGGAAGAAGEELPGQPEAGQRGRGPAGPPQPHGQGEHGDLQQHPAPRQHPLHGRPRAAAHDHPRPRGRLPLQAAHHRVEAEVPGGPEHDAGGGGGTRPGCWGRRRGRAPLPLPHGASALGRAGGHGAPCPHPAPAGRLPAGAHPRGEPGGRRWPGRQRGGRAGQVGDGGGERGGAAGGQPPAPDAGHRHVQAAEHRLRHPQALGDLLVLHQLRLLPVPLTLGARQLQHHHHRRPRPPPPRRPSLGRERALGVEVGAEGAGGAGFLRAG